MLGDLTGKTALVTGAGSGIGRGIARVLAEQGASVAVTDLVLDWATETAEMITDAKTLVLHLDVRDRDAAKTAIDRVIAEWGQLDILVNNAGIRSMSPSGAIQDSVEDWEQMFETNVRGVVNCCDAATPHFMDGSYGKIINIASQAGHAARRFPGAYSVSKAAVLRYTKGLAGVLAPYNVNVNAICPGAVWTWFQQGQAEDLQKLDPSLAGMGLKDIFTQRYEQIIPLGRVQTPEDMGNVAAFLASESARNITGQCINVDGGVIISD